MKKYLILLVALTLLALWPFFKKGYFKSHDGEWMVIRFSAFHQTFAAGQFPVRFVDRLNNNYGYPVLNFLYPLPFYFSEIPKLSGLDFTSSVKFTFIVSTLVSTLAMFWALKEKFSNLASFVGAVVYLYIPYRFVDLYVRGSLGENMAFSFLPIVLGSLFKVENNKKKYLPILSLAIAALILSHNVIAAVTIPLFLLLVLKNKNFKLVLLFLALGFLIASFFWVPALYDFKYVRLSQEDVTNASDHLATINQVLLPSWGYGSSATTGGISPQIGIIAIFIFLLAAFKLTKTKKRFDVVFFTLSFALATFLITKLSTPLWLLPKVDLIQFPWRLLSIVVLSSAFLAAFTTDSYKNKNLVALAIIFVSIVSTISYTKPEVFVDSGDSFYSTNEDTTTVKDEYMPLWVDEKPPQRANQKIEVDRGTIISQVIIPANYKAKISSDSGTNVKVNTIFFPGWEVNSHGQKIPISYKNKNGTINFQLPKGEHEVIIKYKRTNIHLISELVSALALLTTIAYFVRLRKIKNG